MMEFVDTLVFSGAQGTTAVYVLCFLVLGWLVGWTLRRPAPEAVAFGLIVLAGESYARAFHQTSDMETVIVRPFNAFGPRCHHEGDCGEVIPKFMLRCLAGQPMVIFGDGSQTRDFTYVTDTARGIRLAGTATGVAGETINLGRGEEITIRQLAIEMKSVLKREDAPIKFDDARPGDVQRLIADSTKASELLGYAPKVSFREGLKLLAEWYAQKDESAEELLRSEIYRNWIADD